MASLIILSGFLFSEQPEMPFPELPMEAKKTIDKLLSMSDNRVTVLSSRGSYVLSLKYSSKEHERFLQLLTKLSGHVNDELLKKVRQSKQICIEKNLISMARDYAEHPERYKEIINIYGHWVKGFRGEGRPRVLRPSSLMKKHVTERYRRTWELLLLAPLNGATRFMEINGANRVLEAIATIRNDQSIPVLGVACKATVLGGQQQADRQGTTMRFLSHFHNKPALAAMLKCLSLSEKAAKNGKLPKTAGFTVREWVFRWLTDRETFPDAGKWEPVLKDYPMKGLSERDRKMLREALQKLQAAKKKKPKP